MMAVEELEGNKYIFFIFLSYNVLLFIYLLSIVLYNFVIGEERKRIRVTLPKAKFAKSLDTKKYDSISSPKSFCQMTWLSV